MVNRDYFDGKWHVTIPLENETAGVDRKDIRRIRIGSRIISAWVVAVESEAIYRGIMKHVWAELRREARRRDTVSLNQLLEDGFDIADDTADPACQMQKNDFITAIKDYLSTLSPHDRTVAEAILTRRRDSEVMAELGITKQSTYSSWKMKIKRQLQERFAEWLA